MNGCCIAARPNGIIWTENDQNIYLSRCKNYWGQWIWSEWMPVEKPWKLKRTSTTQEINNICPVRRTVRFLCPHYMCKEGLLSVVCKCTPFANPTAQDLNDDVRNMIQNNYIGLTHRTDTDAKSIGRQFDTRCAYAHACLFVNIDSNVHADINKRTQSTTSKCQIKNKRDNE